MLISADWSTGRARGRKINQTQRALIAVRQYDWSIFFSQHDKMFVSGRHYCSNSLLSSKTLHRNHNKADAAIARSVWTSGWLYNPSFRSIFLFDNCGIKRRCSKKSQDADEPVCRLLSRLRKKDFFFLTLMKDLHNTAFYSAPIWTHAPASQRIPQHQLRKTSVSRTRAKKIRTSKKIDICEN